MNWIDQFLFFLKPVDSDVITSEPGTVGSIVDVYTINNVPDLEATSIAIVGINPVKIADKRLLSGPDLVRKKLYGLYYHGNALKFADLGNIIPGTSDGDNEAALREVISPLISRGVGVIILGGSQELTFANYKAYEVLETTVNIAVIDARIDMGEFREALGPHNYLSKIVLQEPGFLFNMSVLGYQSYLNDPETLALFEKLFFDAHRLGSLTYDLRDAEPHVRNADIVSIDMSAVRNADAPGTFQPNGLTGEQICQLCKYAGLSDKTTSIGIYNYNPESDINGQTSLLIAQMIWFIIDGYSRRIKEFPLIHKHDFMEYKIIMPKGNDELVFYKSTRTDKWWLNVPYATTSSAGRPRPFVLPCSYKDYEKACEGEVPDIFWRTYQKLT
jgi:arginase family enzyme